MANLDLQQMDQLIRKGQQGSARDILLEIPIKKVSREQAAAFADLARRLNMPKLMLSVLKPIVYLEIPNAPPPTIHEQALYATALSRIGVFSEAQSILKKISTSDTPEVLLFTAQNLMLQWDYVAAIPKLKKYILHAETSNYQKNVGKVNLASCLIGEMQWKEAEAVLISLKNEIEMDFNKVSEETESFQLLHANSLGLLAHAAFLQGDIAGAEKAIQASAVMLQGSRSRYELLAKKWTAIIELFKHPNDPVRLQSFRALKEEAIKAKDWETVRDFIFFEAFSIKDDEMFLRLYHGTPHTSYRKRIKKIYDPQFQIPKMTEWKYIVSEVDAKVTIPTFDLSKGCEDGGRASLMKQPLLFKLLQFLTKDFFRPSAMGSIFAALYPEEKFNPETSPNRTYLVAKRLRNWFEENNIPLDVEIEKEWFRLIALKNYALRISFQNFNVSQNDALFESVHRYFQTHKFSEDHLRAQFALTESQAQKFLTWAVTRNKMKRSRPGKKAHFQVIGKAVVSN